MPPARKSRRCQAREDGRRCYRNGTGEPPLCRTHKLVLSQRIDPDDPFGQLVDQADRWLKSREGRDTVAQVAGTLFDRILDRVAIPRQERLGPPRPPRAPRAAAAPSPPPPPQVDPIAEARAILHFSPDEPLDRTKIKGRQRFLATELHPDKGGDSAEMQRINQAADLLCNTYG